MNTDKSLESVYNFAEESGVWIKKDGPEFNYSDGDKVETRMGELLRTVHDRSVFSDELKLLQSDWPTTYYFSANRSNLLRPLADKLLHGARVLELGCGMGAITRFLGENCGEVYAVEGSLRRGSVAALRCADLPNVKILIDEIKSLPAELGKFDVITLIGVLEYACRYGGPGSEFKMLELARSFLKPNGFLVLAIENKLGLKYMGGVPEDHIPRRWLGVTNGYARNGVQTWSKKELVRMLRDSGFKYYEQFLALPDYKLPITIITPEGLKEGEKDLSLPPLMNIQQRPYEYLSFFNMGEAWESVINAGLLPDLADSLCFVASPENPSSPFISGELVAHYGNTGVLTHKCAKDTKIKKENNQLKVEKYKLAPGKINENDDFFQIVKSEPYHQGELLLSHARKVVMRPDWTVEELFRALKPWIEMLRASVNQDGYCDGALLDLMPFNIIMQEGKPVPFDLEWVSRKKLPLAYLFYRGIYNTMLRLMPIRKSSRHEIATFQELFAEFMKAQNLPDKMALSMDYLWWQEVKFQRALRGENFKIPYLKDYKLIYMQ